MAKLAVRQHRVDGADVKLWERLCIATMATAKWIARATWVANNCEEAPYRDTEASQGRVAAFKKEEKGKAGGEEGGKAGGGDYWRYGRRC